MGDLTIILEIKNKQSHEWMECVFMALIGQTKVDLSVVITSKHKLDYLQKEIEYLKKFCSVEVTNSKTKKIVKNINTKYLVVIDETDILYPHFSYTLIKYLEENIDDNVVYGTSFLTLLDSQLGEVTKSKYKGDIYFYDKKNDPRKEIYSNACLYRVDFLKTNKLKYDEKLLWRSAKIYEIKYFERDLSEKWHYEDSKNK